METGSYLLLGTEGGSQAFYTTAHGSGRLLGRRQAKKRFDAEEVEARMREDGIYIRARSKGGLAEEAGGSYKDIDAVVESAEAAGLSRRVARLAPGGGIKGEPMPYRHADDGPGSDATVEAWGDTLGELCAAAWQAALEIMLPDATVPVHENSVEIVVDAPDAEQLLFDLLGELIFYKDAENLLLSLEPPEVHHEESGYHLRGRAIGAHIDAERQMLGTDVKAVTLHQVLV